MSHRSFVWLCLLPLVVVTAAFFLLPMARLVVTGAEGPQGLAGYLSILVEPRYRATLINTVLLAAATTVVTLVVATIAGMFLQRHRFPGRAVLIAMLTFPLAKVKQVSRTFPSLYEMMPSDAADALFQAGGQNACALGTTAWCDTPAMTSLLNDAAARNRPGWRAV